MGTYIRGLFKHFKKYVTSKMFFKDKFWKFFSQFFCWQTGRRVTQPNMFLKEIARPQTQLFRRKSSNKFYPFAKEEGTCVDNIKRSTLPTLWTFKKHVTLKMFFQDKFWKFFFHFYWQTWSTVTQPNLFFKEIVKPQTQWFRRKRLKQVLPICKRRGHLGQYHKINCTGVSCA